MFIVLALSCISTQRSNFNLDVRCGSQITLWTKSTWVRSPDIKYIEFIFNLYNALDLCNTTKFTFSLLPMVTKLSSFLQSPLEQSPISSLYKFSFLMFQIFWLWSDSIETVCETNSDHLTVPLFTLLFCHHFLLRRDHYLSLLETWAATLSIFVNIIHPGIQSNNGHAFLQFSVIDNCLRSLWYVLFNETAVNIS